MAKKKIEAVEPVELSREELQKLAKKAVDNGTYKEFIESLEN
jgi:hypothetical protein